MKVLLAIKPEFALKIFEGTKRFEFRRAIFKDTRVKKIIVYASSPVQKVIGEFDIDEIIFLHPNLLWEETKKDAGISKEYFDEYFFERDLGFAIKIKSFKKYLQPLCLQADLKIKTPPQSFMYLD